MKKSLPLVTTLATLGFACTAESSGEGRSVDPGDAMTAAFDGEVHDAGGGAPDTEALPPDFLQIIEPMAGSAFVRDQVGSDGALVAPITFRAQGGSAVASVDWMAEDDYALGTGAPPDFAITYPFHGDGNRWVTATARDADGATLLTARVDFMVSPAPASDCHGMLDSLGVEFTAGPYEDGVDDPVTVTLPIVGISYQYAESTDGRVHWMMDCQLALALARAAVVLHAHDVVEVTDLGIYNYRCIDQSVDPPDCPGSSLSMHAHALAVDYAGLTTSAGAYYSIEDDWVIDPDSEDTCTAGTSGVKDTFLHEVLCDLHAADIFTIYLTPNYNAAHRNHWHLDLTPGGDYLEAPAPPSGRDG